MRRLVLQEDMKHWPPDQADLDEQDGWATGTPCQEAGVLACRGAGDQENADRDSGTDRSASAGTWLARCIKVEIGDCYGVVLRQEGHLDGDGWSGVGNLAFLRSVGK